MVLMHGGAGSWEHWRPSVPALSKQFRAIALDLPGYGDSQAPPAGTDNDGYLALVAEAVEEITAAEHHVHLAGFSFGAVVAAATGLALGPRAASLTMIGGAGFGPPIGRGFTLESRRRLEQRLGRPATADELRAMHRRNLALLMMHDAALIDAEAVEMQWRNVERTRFDSRRISWSESIAGLVARLDCPVLAVYGEHDAAAIPPIDERFRRLRAARPDIETAIIPGCGHWTMYERTTETDALLLDFLARAEARQRAESAG